MLQVKHLVKRYVTKGGTVTALNDVSVDFPETGMVFLLGKSGSGKSTLLNISGGLDAPDEGEVIVNGKSSKDFSKSDFDSYRNTYLGFIFQEYNILTELTVAENVALALELQGKPRDPERVAELLRQVDLEGFADRRPNTLSGGQKQRVAIARALVKDPEIIMADEPTGALDSKTGAQVFDTLKKLSATKLVVIVSHDREFAEAYADRIIELRDGNIISDVTRGERIELEQKNVSEVTEKKLAVASGASLTAEEEEKILSFVRKHKGGVVLTSEEEDLSRLPEERTAYYTFKETEQRELPPQQDTCSFIASKFPFRYSLKMGLSGLRVKPVRLIFTTLLATIAFLVFGVFSTLITFDAGNASAATLEDSSYGAAVLEKHGVLHIKTDLQEDVVRIDTGSSHSHFSEAEIEQLRSRYPQMNFIPAYDLEITSGLAFWNRTQNRKGRSELNNTGLYYDTISAFTAFADAKYLEGDASLKLVAGNLPASDTECLVSIPVYETYVFNGYYSGGEELGINRYEDLIGKTIGISNRVVNAVPAENRTITLTITGIVDTGEDFSDYNHLRMGYAQSGYTQPADWVADLHEMREHFSCSMASLCWVDSSFLTRYFPSDLEDLKEQYLSETLNESGVADRFDYSNFLKKDANGEYVRESEDLGGSRPPWRPQSPDDIFWHYHVSEEAEAEGSYVGYLFVSLAGDRAAKSAALFAIAKDGNAAYDIEYSTPYSFVKDVTGNRDNFNRILLILGGVAVGLAVFAALLLYSFISSSITAKRRDIGILRAVGARGIDVFQIFMVEGVAITLLCFGLGSLLSYIACIVANGVLMSTGVYTFKLFLFGPLNALIVFAISFLTAIVSTVIPVSLTVRKKPVEAIRSV